ncbi:hypothetical protein FRC08_018316, partial [Ceratobasidium sp. 394]
AASLPEYTHNSPPTSATRVQFTPRSPPPPYTEVRDLVPPPLVFAVSPPTSRAHGRRGISLACSHLLCWRAFKQPARFQVDVSAHAKPWAVPVRARPYGEARLPERTWACADTFSQPVRDASFPTLCLTIQLTTLRPNKSSCPHAPIYDSTLKSSPAA